MLERNDWNRDVKKAINDFLSDSHDHGYAVFDFDNTCSIYDCALVALHYQIEHMAFKMTPEELIYALSQGISKQAIYKDYLDDIDQAYTYLYHTYGPFNKLEATVDHNDPYYNEFMVKMFTYYGKITELEGSSIGDAWVCNWFSNMSEKEAYDLTYRCLKEKKDLPTIKYTWKTSSNIQSKLGIMEHSYVDGIQVTENIKELWKNLYEHHIDIWVCTASPINVVQAAIDVFDLHPYCTGLIGMTLELKNDRYIPFYDYETGYAMIADKQGWHKDTIPSKTITQSEGKVRAINNILVPRYHHGPDAGFMDSQGDFNFCTEYKDTKLVVCFNRADRSYNEGGGLIAEAAMLQKAYQYDYFHTNGDTYYVLQGRDEEGLRSFIDSECTKIYGTNELRRFKNEKNEYYLNYFINQHLTTKEVFDQYSLKNENYGFLNKYDGYHSK